jgi:hypothetical protein
VLHAGVVVIAAAPVAPVVLTVKLSRAAAALKLHATMLEGHALSFRVGKCKPVGSTMVCSFSMRMHGTATCRGLVQLRVYRGDLQGRYVRVVCA